MKKIITLLAVILIGGSIWLLISGNIEFTEEIFSTSSQEEGENGVTQIEWSSETITDQDGNILVKSETLPSMIEVSEEASFGASGEISEALLSPKKTNIGFSSHGAVHSSGWIYYIDSGDLQPVAFQYGGNVSVNKWSPNGEYLIFTLSTPAGTDILWVVNSDSREKYVSETGFTVKVSEENELDPPYSYTFIEWTGDSTFCFSLEEQEYCMNALTQEIE